MLMACGGTAAPAGSLLAPAAPKPGGGATQSSPLNQASVISVAPGQSVGAIDIAVPAPAGSPAANAQDLGVADLGGSGRAFNTGDVIHRGTNMRVLMFGPGLDGSVTVVVRGPNDISVSDVGTISSTTGVSGISFTAAVSPNAALGARTVVVQTAQGDVTTFTGGLEVVP